MLLAAALLLAGNPDFFWKQVRPYIGDALAYLCVTQEGKQWIANNAKDLDPDKDQSKIQEIKRFSDDYFAIVTASREC